MSEHAAGSQTMLYALLNQLIVTVYRLRYADRGSRLKDDAHDFARLLHYVEQNIDKPVTLKELSYASGWSSRHLQRLFQAHTEQSFGTFLRHLRIQKSCELLRTSTLKIGLISELVGYRDADSFHAAFKKNVGLTPSEYRKTSLSQQ
jgi:Transcriptional regulator containing an amidase domain and an AraC-type DNA-binding HTH domain